MRIRTSPTRTGTLRTGTLRTGTLRTGTLRTGTLPSRSSRRAVFGLALGAALGGVPAGLAVAKPQPPPKARRKPKAGAGRRPSRQPQRRPRRPRFKVVTRTFTSTVPITIPYLGAASPYPATLPVSGFRVGKILDVNVKLSGFSHEYPADLEVILVAPDRQAGVVLMSDGGSYYAVTNITVVFDDQATSFLPVDTQLVSGTYKPTLPGPAPGSDRATLRSFAGLNPNGTWRLYVADGSDTDLGSIAGWALTIKARVRA